MHINSIEINNFKGLINSAINFPSKFTLLIGGNSLGKTSVLEAISVALGAFLLNIPNVNSIHFTKDEIRQERVPIGDGSAQTIYHVPIAVKCDLTFDGHTFQFVRVKKETKSARTTAEPRTICKYAADILNTTDLHRHRPSCCRPCPSCHHHQTHHKIYDTFRNTYPPDQCSDLIISLAEFSSYRTLYTEVAKYIKSKQDWSFQPNGSSSLVLVERTKRMKMTTDVKQAIANIHNSLMTVQTNGNSSMVVTDCLRALRVLLQTENIELEQTVPSSAEEDRTGE